MERGSVHQFEQLKRASFDASPVPMAVFDPHHRFVAVNQAMATINRAPVGDHIGRHPRDVFGTDGEFEHWLDIVDEVLRSGEARYGVELISVEEHGHVRYAFEGDYVPVADELGAVVAVLASVREVTFERQMQLRALHHLTIAESLASARSIEQVAAAVLGVERGLACRAQVELRSAPELGTTRDATALTTRSPGAGSEPQVIEFVHGVLRLWLHHGERLEAPDLAELSSIVRLADLAIDRIEAANQQRRSELLAVLDALPVDVSIGVPVREGEQIVDFELAYMNDRSTDGVGRRAEDLVGRRVLESFPGFVDQGLFEIFREVVETGRGYEDGARHYQDQIDDVAVDGYWALSVQPFRAGYMVASRDVTSEVLANRALAEAEVQRAAIAVLQRVALPEEIPDVTPCELAAVYAPASSDAPVGGDWYDAFWRPNGALTLLVGDVAGHGPEAAVDMVRLRNMLRQVAHSSRSPAEVLAALNQTYASSGTGFATCLVVDLDPLNHAMAWATAGHPPPVVRSGAHAHALAGGAGKPLGVDGSSGYELHLSRLEPGEIVILYTDGLVERRGSSIDADIDELCGRAAALDDANLESFVQALTDHRAANDDDACILALRCS